VKKSVSIIGGGPSAMILAAFLDTKKFDVHIYEKNKALGRKFLVAGKGGFNLTHAEEIISMKQKYSPKGFLDLALDNFDNTSLRQWLDAIGIPSFIGTSHRVFPVKGIKPIDVLTKIKNLIEQKNVSIYYGHEWDSSIYKGIKFKNGQSLDSDYIIFALGGASWKITGSSADWTQYFQKHKVDLKPFMPSNCAYQIKWPSTFIKQYEGEPLKNITLSVGNITQKGEVVVTQFGVEGNAVYACSPEIRTQLNAKNIATVAIDLKPHLSKDQIISKFQNSKSKNTTQILREVIKLSKLKIGLLKHFITKDQFLDTNVLIDHIKSFELVITDFAPIDEAISTVGGIALSEVDDHFQLRKLPNHFCIGEMLDWDAPTGGYLLQACFSMGVWLAKYMNEHL